MASSRISLSRSLLLRASALAGMALAFAAPASAQQSATLRLGMDESLSGVFTSVGVPPSTAVRMAVKEINEAGGFKVGDRMVKIQLVETDNKSETAAAVANAIKLVEDEKIKFIFGPTVSALANQAQEVTTANNVLHISAAGSWQTLGYLADPKKPLLFGTQLPLSTIGKIDADGLTQLGVKKVAFISRDDDTTKGSYPSFETEVKAAGIQVVPLLFPPNTTDFSSLVSRAKGENVDAIYILQPQALGPDLLRTAVDLKAGPKGFAGRQLSPDVALKLATGSPVAIPYFSTQSSPSFDYPPNDKVKAYTERLRAMGNPLGVTANFSFFAYDFVTMLTRAMTAAGTIDDTAKVAAALGAMSYDGVAGKICFGKELRTATYDGGEIFVRDGKVESKTFASTCK